MKYINVCPLTWFWERAFFFRSVEEEKLDQLRTIRYIFYRQKGGEGGPRIFNGLITLPPLLISVSFLQSPPPPIRHDLNKT